MGQGEPAQVAPLKGSVYYNEKHTKQYTKYDVDLANKYLDEAGYAKRDAQGWRLGPDGKRITFTVTTRSDKTHMNDVMEMVVPMWQKVGVYALNRPVEKSLQRALRSANKHEGIIDDGQTGTNDLIFRPDMFVPMHGNSAFGSAWYHWYVGIKDAPQEEPPPEIRKLCDMYDKIKTISDLQDQQRLMRQITDLAGEQFLHFGIATRAPDYGIVRKNLRNVPEGYSGNMVNAQPGASDLSQLFFEGGQR
jgi:peptide/nickel transport system substrate-binding protein